MHLSFGNYLKTGSHCVFFSNPWHVYLKGTSFFHTTETLGSLHGWWSEPAGEEGSHLADLWLCSVPVVSPAPSSQAQASSGHVNYLLVICYLVMSSRRVCTQGRTKRADTKHSQPMESALMMSWGQLAGLEHRVALGRETGFAECPQSRVQEHGDSVISQGFDYVPRELRTTCDSQTQR